MGTIYKNARHIIFSDHPDHKNKQISESSIMHFFFLLVIKLQFYRLDFQTSYVFLREKIYCELIVLIKINLKSSNQVCTS